MIVIDADEMVGGEADDTVGADADENVGADADENVGVVFNDNIGADADDTVGADADDNVGVDADEERNDRVVDVACATTGRGDGATSDGWNNDIEENGDGDVEPRPTGRGGSRLPGVLGDAGDAKNVSSA